MIQITVFGPEHSKKDYIMLTIAKALREAGAEVKVLGENSYFAHKAEMDEETIKSKLEGQSIRISEQRTAV
jgi:hypothetical protein